MFLWQSLIGHFDLDPNRVFDIVSFYFLIRVLLSDIVKVCYCYNIIMFFSCLPCQVLECFELYPDNNIFYQLIPLFPKVFL
jgi:THO complex subunit 2